MRTLVYLDPTMFSDNLISPPPARNLFKTLVTKKDTYTMYMYMYSRYYIETVAKFIFFIYMYMYVS